MREINTYFGVWAFLLFTFNIFVTLPGFWIISRSFDRASRSLDRAVEVLTRQETQQQEIWQRLFVKADNTERITQAILTRMVDESVQH